MFRALVIVALATVVVLGGPIHLSTVGNTTKYRPVVLLHGLLGTQEAMNSIEKWLKDDYPGIYVHNLALDTGKDKWFSMFTPMHKQLDLVYQKISADPNLKDGFDMVGHSQGGLLTRAYLVKYNKPTCHNYISLAGPQQGVYGVPDLNAICPDSICPWIAEIMSKLAEGKDTEWFFQNYISFAQYWKNPMNYTKYLDTNTFLTDINNEEATKNAAYRANFIRTTGKMVFVKAMDDHIVIPKESEWWGFYENDSDKTTYNMTSSPTYKGDWIGLKTVDQRGDLSLKEVPCTHQDMTRPVCKSSVYDGIIKGLTGGKLN